MPQNNLKRGRQPPAKRTAAEALEAEKRAYAGLSVILKTFGVRDLPISDPSRPLGAVTDLLVSLGMSDFDSTVAKRILRAGVIGKLIKYLADFRFLADGSSMVMGNERQNVRFTQH